MLHGVNKVVIPNECELERHDMPDKYCNTLERLTFQLSTKSSCFCYYSSSLVLKTHVEVQNGEVDIS